MFCACVGTCMVVGAYFQESQRWDGYANLHVLFFVVIVGEADPLDFACFNYLHHHR